MEAKRTARAEYYRRQDRILEIRAHLLRQNLPRRGLRLQSFMTLFKSFIPLFLR